MLLNGLWILLGLGCLIWGGDRFVVGAAALARKLGISPLLIGTTIVAVGTSAPELFVSIIASIEQRPGIAIGNALGSNIANIGLVVGLLAILKPIKVPQQMLSFEFPLLFAAMLITVWIFHDSNLTQLDGAILLIMFAILLVVILTKAYYQNRSAIITPENQSKMSKLVSLRVALIWISIGMVFLPIGSELLILGASNIARLWNIDELVIGLTIVAVGTSLPELVTSLVGIVKQEDEIALGNVVGSNLFNLGILGFPGWFAPANFSRMIVVRDFMLMFVLTVLFYWMSCFKVGGNGLITRFHGCLLLLIYAGYLMLLAHQ